MWVVISNLKEYTSGIGIEVFSLRHFSVATSLRSIFCADSSETIACWPVRGERKTQSSPSSNETKMTQFMLPVLGVSALLQLHDRPGSPVASNSKASRLNFAYENIFSGMLIPGMMMTERCVAEGAERIVLVLAVLS